MINTLVRAADFLYFHSPAAFVTQQRDTLVVRGERGNELADALFDLLFTTAFLPGVRIRLVRLLPEGADEAERVFVRRNGEGITPFVLPKDAEAKEGQNLTVCFAEDGDFNQDAERDRIAWAADLGADRVPAFDLCETAYRCTEKDIPAITADEEQSEALRIARRVHMAYTATWNSRYTEEEITADLYGDPDGAGYCLRSSLRLAASVPWKLAAAGIQTEENTPETLYHKLNGADKKIRNLLAWQEHRSWQAFMTLDGWRTPTPEELNEYVFRNGNDHRNKKEKWHPCLCDLAEDDWFAPHPKKLKTTQIHCWSEEQARPEGYCLLDQMSLRIHHLCKERVVSEEYAEEMNSLFRDLETAIIDGGYGLNEELTGLARRMENMFRRLRGNETNSYAPWQQACAEFLEILGKGEDAEEIRKVFKTIRREAKIAEERNRYRDYKEIDMQIIRWLPWILTKEKIQTVWKLYAAENPLDNLLSSIILRPAQLHLICEKKDARNVSVDAFRGMLEQHGTGETQILVSQISDLNEKTVPVGPHDVADVTGCGELQYRLRIPSGARIVYYGNDDLQDRMDAPFFAPIYHPYDFAMTVNEVLRLRGKELLSDVLDNELLGMEEDYQTLWQARWNVPKYAGYPRWAWHHTIRALQVAEKSNLHKIPRKKDSESSQYRQTFPPDHYETLSRNGAIRTLQELESEDCISGLLIDPDQGVISCQVFPDAEAKDPYAQTKKYLDDMIGDDREDSFYAFDYEYEGNEKPRCFINLADPLRLDDAEGVAGEIRKKDLENKWTNVPTVNAIRVNLLSGIRTLTNDGLLQDLGNGTYRYKSIPVRQGLRKEGAALEAYVYYTLFLSGRFDDIRSNVRLRKDGSAQDSSLEKELDILVSRRGRVGVISCKDTVNISLFHIGELRMQADRYAVNARPILACSREPDQEVQDMCENLDVGLIWEINDNLPMNIIRMIG